MRAIALAAILAGTAGAGVGRAQEPLAPPAPLTHTPAAPSRAATVVTLAAAQRAQDLGLPSIAADLYRQLLESPGADRGELSLALVTALLDAGRAADAQAVLASLSPPHSAGWRLRAGLAALQLGQRDAAQAEWDAIKGTDVLPADLPWYWFFTGALYDTASPRDVSRANDYYIKAEAGALTDLARARFQLAGEQVRLHLYGKPTEADLKQARQNQELFAGRAYGYDAARNYAVMQAEAGQRAEAVASLQRVLVGIPAQERGARDDLRFVLGLIGDRGRNGAGRNALNQLLENGQNAQRQRQALQLLAEASREEPARSQFRTDLGKWIGTKPPHPVLESLLFYRAQLALADKDFLRAEDDANALLKQFPLSPLRVHAHGVLTQSAWEQQRYRAAADYARKTRADMAALGAADGAAPSAAGASPSRARMDLGVVEAEAWFRAGDYRNAADAYAAVLRERPADLEPRRTGELIFQRALAEIKAGAAGAGKVLDELESDPAFDPENRWQAEWSLARALLLLPGDAGVREAYARINGLLREPPAEGALKPELRARMDWLRARLSFEIGEPAETIRLVEASLQKPVEVEPALQAEVASILMLLKARAEFAVGREPAALETLKRLRVEHPKTDAAISSYLIESEHYAVQDKIEEARNRLISLTDNPDPDYKSSPYVPYALFRLALLSERLGREENLKEANRRIEELIELTAKTGTDHDLIFAARLKQGDVFRKRNDFPAAQRAYENLVNLYAKRPDVVLAYLALAECHNAQSSTDQDHSHAAAAKLIFEQLRDRVDAPIDVRVEAGYNLGALLARTGAADEAAKVWWNDVVTPFLRDNPRPLAPGAKSPYWLARTLCELGDLQDKRGRYEEAKAAYLLVLEKRLPFGEATARARLQQLGVPGNRTGQ